MRRSRSYCNLLKSNTWKTFILQAYFREGIALQCLGRHGDSLAAFAAGLAQDPKNTQLLAGMVEAAIKSPLKGASQMPDDCHLNL